MSGNKPSFVFGNPPKITIKNYSCPISRGVAMALLERLNAVEEALRISKKLLTEVPNERVAEPDFVRLASLLVQLEVE